jgi:hypothetical protein
MTVAVSTLLCIYTRTVCICVQIPSRGSDTWSVLSLLFSSEYFATLLLGAVAAAATVMLGMISVDQLRNAAANTTTNERMNRARYPWMRAGGWNFNLEVCSYTFFLIYLYSLHAHSVSSCAASLL